MACYCSLSAAASIANGEILEPNIFAAFSRLMHSRALVTTLGGARKDGVADYATEIRITLCSIAVTAVAWGAVTWETLRILSQRLHVGAIGGSIEQVIFIVIVEALIYGNFVYQFTQ